MRSNFYTVDISNKRHRASFNNAKKSFLIMRIQVVTEARATPEPHFLDVYGGEEGAILHKLHKEMIVKGFFDIERRETLLAVIGESWYQAAYSLNREASGYDVIFLPKVILKNPSTM